MIEISPEEFTERHRHYAADGLIYPQPEGSPLLEFAAGGRVLYLLDRCGPYAARPGTARVIVNGVVTQCEHSSERHERLTVVGVSGLEGTGQILERPPGGAVTLVVRARLTLVLNAHSPLTGFAPGDWIDFSTEAPLHGFVVAAS